MIPKLVQNDKFDKSDLRCNNEEGSFDNVDCSNNLYADWLQQRGKEV